MLVLKKFEELIPIINQLLTGGIGRFSPEIRPVTGLPMKASCR
jgi:hypothetical protein